MEEMQDSALWRAIVIGAAVGVTAMFLVGTAIVFIGDVSLGLAAGIGAWVGFVIGPYVGGFAVLSRGSLKAEHHDAEVARAGEHEELRPAA